MSKEFEAAHERFVKQHLEARSGERRGRLERGHQYAEKLFLRHIWWPLLGRFDDLHPEYEVQDWNRRSQFLDFAFLPRGGARIGIECDGFQSHIKDMDREKFSHALNRDSFLTGMGWKMLHFSFDDIRDRLEVCRMLLQLSLGPLTGTASAASPSRLSPEEKDVLRLAWSLGQEIRPKDLRDRYGFCHRKARGVLNSLVRHNLLRPISGGTYMCKYETTGSFPEALLRS
ncbi:hypothetical protein [Saccharibacillus brassicae]|uniref:DUF559 domain-containing protein n=1 Tax=Saccharibacillus brassicae TaxID=2583377 RepID=A0A4Y6V3L8_SACBS|nr:hypothetical protein [Saccharibacillus brassicae]QDH23107.1 hypothetical protein FFV09_20960 [Saccharibacillus brassicae]